MTCMMGLRGCTYVGYCLLHVVTALFLLYPNAEAGNYIHARCDISRGSGIGEVEGTIFLKQPSTGGDTSLAISLTGFPQTADGSSLHGFHVHKGSGIGNKCGDAGAHYNPGAVVHAGPADQIRHIGDLGNVEVNAKGHVHTTIIDKVVSLVEDHSVINRTIVVHAAVDDLGRGSFPDSKTTGHAGGRLGCCVIVRATSGASRKNIGLRRRPALTERFIARQKDVGVQRGVSGRRLQGARQYAERCQNRWRCRHWSATSTELRSDSTRRRDNHRDGSSDQMWP